MSFITLIFGLIIGFIGGMIVAAGGWRNALGRLGACATRAAKAPPALRPEPLALPAAASADHQSGRES